MRSGQLQRLCKKKTRSIHTNLTTTVPVSRNRRPNGIDDKCEELPFVHLHALLLVIGTIFTWIIPLVTTVAMSMAQKWEFVDSRERRV